MNEAYDADIEFSGDEWMTTLCDEGHTLCYKIRHKGDLLHFQPGSLEWNHAKLMQALNDVEGDGS